MNNNFFKIIYLLTSMFILCATSAAFGWHDKTHMAVSKAAGHEQWYNSAGPDVTKTKAGEKEGKKHYCGNHAITEGDKVHEVTADIVLNQVKFNLYDNCIDDEGHLYGAIVASLNKYIESKREEKKSGKYAGYHLAFCAHYIGDLSMPLHNVPHGKDKKGPYGKFNQEHHTENDAIVENNDLDQITLQIIGRMDKYKIKKITDEHALCQEIAKIATKARNLACSMVKDKERTITADEAYEQLAQSAALLQAVLEYAKQEIAKEK